LIVFIDLEVTLVLLADRFCLCSGSDGRLHFHAQHAAVRTQDGRFHATGPTPSRYSNHCTLFFFFGISLINMRTGNIHQSANTIAAAFRYYKAHRYLSLIRSEIKKLQESGKEEFDDEILGGIRVWRATRDLDRKHQLMLSQILVFKTYRTDVRPLPLFTPAPSFCHLIVY
jgi:hypothetical protein